MNTTKILKAIRNRGYIYLTKTRAYEVATDEGNVLVFPDGRCEMQVRPGYVIKQFCPGFIFAITEKEKDA